MKVFSKEEGEQMLILKQGRHTRVHVFLAALQPGEILFIEKGKDWVSKNPPYRVIKLFEKKSGRQFEKGRSTDGKGWLVRRVK